MTYTKFFTIKDYNTSPLWAGEEVVVMITAPLTFTGQNIVSPVPKTFQIVTLTSADGGSYINNYNRRKTAVSYSGFQPLSITAECVFQTDFLSNTNTLDGSVKKIFTPSKLFELILKPRTIYLNDHLIVPLLITDQDNSPAVYSSKGIPVILDSWSFSAGVNNKEIIMSLTFIEDKEV